MHKEKLTEAEAAGKRLRVEASTGARMVKYRCEHCKHWHIAHALTNKPKRNRR